MTVDEAVALVRARQRSGAASTYEVVLADEVADLRAAKHVFARENGRLHARIAELETKLLKAPR